MKDIRKASGTKAETAAADYLSRQGVRIIQKNFRSRYGEIDLIGWDGSYYLFIEVKLRTSYEQGFPAEAVDYQKQRRICQTFNYYRMKHKLDEYVPVRFDIVEVKWDGTCHWLKNAFDYIE